MAQWVNRLQNNIFVNPSTLPLLCKISGALHLRNRVLRQAGRLDVRPADEIQVNFEIFKVGCRSKYSTCRFVNQGTAIISALPMHSSWFFRIKPIARLIFKAQNFPEAI